MQLRSSMCSRVCLLTVHEQHIIINNNTTIAALLKWIKSEKIKKIQKKYNQRKYNNNTKSVNALALSLQTSSETGWRYCSAPAKQLTTTTRRVTYEKESKLCKIIARKVLLKSEKSVVCLCFCLAVHSNGKPAPAVTCFIHARTCMHAPVCAFVRICVTYAEESE